MSNHDGKEGKNAYVVPSPIGQDRLLRRIYDESHTDPKSIFYVECHGTGTQIGDPVETNTIGNFFSRSLYEPPLLIGSIKSVIGHTEGASGVSALIKAALCLHKGMITPNMHFKEINSRIKVNEYNLHVVTRATLLPSNRNAPNFIGVNSFGMGGNNCHAIVHSYASDLINGRSAVHEILGSNNDRPLAILSNCPLSHKNTQAVIPLDECKQHFIFTFTAKCKASLDLQAKTVLQWLSKQATHDVESSGESSFLAALSQKLLLKRTTSFDHRVSFVVNQTDKLRKELESFLSSSFSTQYVVSQKKGNSLQSVCFVFGGQGPQWWAMGRQLYECESIFRTWINSIDSELRLLTTDWNLLDEIFGPSSENESHINETNIAQPALFAIQVALAALWISWGVRPSVIVGHSMGEIAAVFVAGRLTLREAVIIVYHRARLQHRNTRKNGRMIALNLSEQEAFKLLQGIENQVCIAAINSSRSVTLSGDSDALEKLIDVIDILHPKVGRFWLRVENAFHSHQMLRHDIKECLDESLKHIAGENVETKDLFDVGCSKAQLYSTVTGGRIDGNFIQFNSHYWWQNMRQPVMFHQAISALLNDNREKPIEFFIELSPHPVLASSLEDIIGPNSSILASLKRKNDEEQCMLTALCHLIDNRKDWESWLKTRHYYTEISNRHISEMLWDLPYYMFNNSKFWYETKDSILTRRAHRSDHHPLLGNRVWTRPYALWKNFISLSSSELLYLKDHQVNSEMMFPAAGFLEMVYAAAHELTIATSTTAIVLERIRLLKALVIKDNESIEVHTIILLPSHDFYIYSRKSQREDYVRHGGIASNDIVVSYSDKQVLQEYKEREWKLHVHGVINLKVDLTLEPSTSQNLGPKYEQLREAASWRLEGATAQHQLYASLEYRGYQYGPQFQSIQTVCGSYSEIAAELSCSNSTSDYYFHPSLLDGCLQSSLILLPMEHTFVPVFIDKVTFQVIEPNMKEEGNLRVFASYSPIIRGLIGNDENFTADVWLLTDKNHGTCLISFDGVKLQSITGTLDVHRSKTSIFDRLKKFVWLPNPKQTALDSEKLFNEFCFEPIWIKQNITSESESSPFLLPRPSDLFATELIATDSTIQTASDAIKHGCSETDQAAIESFDKISQWIADIARYVLNELIGNDKIERNKVDELVTIKRHKLLDILLELVNNYNKSDKINRFSLRMQYAYLVQTYPKLAGIFSLIDSCTDHLKEFLQGRKDPLQWLFGAENEHHLQEYYTTISQTNTRIPFQAIVNYLHKNSPSMIRVLEVGAGTGGSTVHVLDVLLEFANTTNIPVDYVFTDISPSFFASAQSKFAHLLDEKNQHGLLRLTYQVLNLDMVPTTLRESFHIVFGCNVVHATENIVRSLQHIRQLLLPGGLAIVIEFCLPIPYLDLIFGLLPQWWFSEQSDDELRHGEMRAIVNISTWKKAFEIAGGYTHFDASCSKIGLATIIAQKTDRIDQISLFPERKERVWIIFCDQYEGIGSSIAIALEQIHREKNIACIYCDSNASVENGHISVKAKNLTTEIQAILSQFFDQFSEVSIIFAWPLDLQLCSFHEEEHATFFQHQDQLCLALLKIVQTCQVQKMANRRPRLFIITSNAQQTSFSQNHNFLQSPFIGFGRSILHEYDHGCVKLIDLQIKKKISSIFVEQLISQFLSKEIPSDNEIAVIEVENGKAERYVLRYGSISAAVAKTSINSSQCHQIESDKDFDEHPFCLEIPTSRFLTDLQWIFDNRISLEQLLPTQLIIRIHCVGLIFRDLLQVQGLYPHSSSFSSDETDKDDSVGLEFAGTVAYLGSEAAKTYVEGDRVFGIVSEQGAFRSHIILDAINIVKAPNCCSMEQLASLPIAFLTVLLALKERVRLQANHTCLIHSASGAVGLATIQYCRLVGARVIATAGTDEKRQFLREKMGVEHVFDSRNLSFVDDVRQVASDGVDVIINSLSGVLMQRSMTLLASNGHFVELGKREIFHNATLPMFAFRKECTWHVIDAFYHHKRYPHMTQTLLSLLADLLNHGSLKPIEPITVFEANQIIDAFMLFKRSSHIGKLVVRITSSQQSLRLMLPNNAALIQKPPCSSKLPSEKNIYTQK